MNKILIILSFLSITLSQGLAEEPLVVMTWPEKAEELTDIRLSGMRPERAYPVVQKQFQEIFERSIRSFLEEGQQLKVTIKDIDLAGDIEPWRGGRFSDVRIIRSIYPARLSFSWQLKSAEGSVLKEGEERLVSNMVTRPHGFGSNDNLAYERDLIRRWGRQTLR